MHQVLQEKNPTQIRCTCSTLVLSWALLYNDTLPRCVNEHKTGRITRRQESEARWSHGHHRTLLHDCGITHTKASRKYATRT